MALHTAAPQAPAGSPDPSTAAAPGATGEAWEGAQVRGHLRPVSGYTRADLVRALARFRQIDTALGVRLLVVDLLMIAGGFALVLLADALWLRVLGSLLVGFKLGAVYTLAHDAVHGNLVRGAALNRWIATFCYWLTFHNYRIRQYDHMLLGHHPHLNGPQHDAWRPLSPQEYAAASPVRRAWERFLRAPIVVSFFAYGVAERWWRAEFFPPAPMPAQHKREARWLQAAVVAWILALVAVGVASALGRGSPVWLEVLLVFGLPVFVFQTLQGMVLYVQHTHPDVPWFGPGDALIERFGPESLTVHVQAPRILGAGTHDILEHPVHHVVPAIPCYRLHAAQTELTRLLGERALRTHLFAFRRLAEVMRTCKLYDYENHRWTDFEGRPTATTQAAALLPERALTSSARTLMAA
jgi:omega-6 fatty acid desaturase (delta-12 desaturase)